MNSNIVSEIFKELITVVYIRITQSMQQKRLISNCQIALHANSKKIAMHG